MTDKSKENLSKLIAIGIMIAGATVFLGNKVVDITFEDVRANTAHRIQQIEINKAHKTQYERIERSLLDLAEIKETLGRMDEKLKFLEIVDD